MKTNGVILPSRFPFETLDDQLPKRVPDDPGYPPLIYKRQFVPPKDMVVRSETLSNVAPRINHYSIKGGTPMKNNGSLMKPVILIWLAFAAILVMAALCPSQALAQLPARFYWKSLSGANAVPLIVESLSGNTNPFRFCPYRNPGSGFQRYHGPDGLCPHLFPV